LGVWTRLELALYVASHGGANWHAHLGTAASPPTTGWEARPAAEGVALAGNGKKAAAASGGMP
jgi:hypothetical protein